MCTHFTFYAKIFTVGENLSDKVLTKIILLSFLRHGVEASSKHWAHYNYARGTCETYKLHRIRSASIANTVDQNGNKQ